MFKDFQPTIINKSTSTEVMLKHQNRSLIIIFEGATSALDFRQVFNISYFYHRGAKKWFHTSTYKKLISVYKAICVYIAQNEDEFDEIIVKGFSQGGSLAEQLFMMLTKVLGLKNVFCFILDPFKGVLGFNEYVYVCKKSIVWRWPLFLAGPKKIYKSKSPYKWWQFVKNHFWLRECYE